MNNLIIERYQKLWLPQTTYLNTASFGLPPTPAFEALQKALEDWRFGRTSWENWAQSAEESRKAFARLISVKPDSVAIGANVSSFIGLLAASLPKGSKVVVPEIEFTSNLFPWLSNPDIQVTTVPLKYLAEEMQKGYDICSFSMVQSATGEIVDLPSVQQAAKKDGCLLIADLTQSAGWLPIEGAQVDVAVCSAYKWLMSPRGSAFAYINPEHASSIIPYSAGWYAGENPFESLYGPPLRLANSTRRLDISPAWFSWVGTAPVIELLEEITIEKIHSHNVELANYFLKGLDLAPSNSAIVSIDLANADIKFKKANIQAATRAGGLRASFHLYNTIEDVEKALSALRS